MTAARAGMRQEQRSMTRRRIADAARRCFYEAGVGETSIEQIARTAGVGRATLYLHFANKEAILLELLASNLRGVRSLFRELCELERADAPAVRLWLQSYVSALEGHRDAMRLFQIGLANDAAARRMIDHHRGEVAQLLAARYPRIGLDDPVARARLILALARVDHVASVAAGDEAPFDVDAGIELVAAELAALFRDQA